MAVTPSGKDKVLKYARLYVGGFDLSGDLRDFGTIENSYESASMLGVSETTDNFLAAGSLMTAINGLQVLMNDTATSGSHTLLSSAPNQSQVSIHFGGGGAPAVGDPGYLLPTEQLGDAISIDAASAVMAANFAFDQRQYSGNITKVFGIVMRGNTSLSATLTASSTNSVDQGAQSTAGWAAHIHILSTSSGNFALSIEDSADDSAFGTLGTFTTTGGSVGSELLTGSGTVERYVAFDAQRTAGTITAIVTFTRG